MSTSAIIPFDFESGKILWTSNLLTKKNKEYYLTLLQINLNTWQNEVLQIANDETFFVREYYKLNREYLKGTTEQQEEAKKYFTSNATTIINNMDDIIPAKTKIVVEKDCYNVYCSFLNDDNETIDIETKFKFN